MPYRGSRVWAAPGLTAGPTLIDVLSRLATSLDPGAAPGGETYAAYAEALQAAYAARLRGMGAGSDADRASCTSHLGVTDREGTVVTLTQTLLSPFGAKVMLPETGILLNNGIMWFDPRPGRPNSIAPGKRPLSNMCPTVVELADGRRAGLGASGGRRILPAVAQLLSFLADFGMSPDDAAHCPRINVDGPDLVEADARLAAERARHAGGPVRAGRAAPRRPPVVVRLPQRCRLGPGERHCDRHRPRDVPQRVRRRAVTSKRRYPWRARRASA